MEVIRLNIQAYTDRERIVTGLANAGYHVWIDECDGEWVKQYFVCFEVKEQKNG